MDKKTRELIRNKYNNRCAYCGVELNSNFHVDEIVPVRRKYKYMPAHWKNTITGEIQPILPEGANRIDWQHRSAKYAPDGCHNPENYNLQNQNPACPSCNINKHEMSLEQFRKLIAGFMKHLNEHSTQYKIAKRYGLITETNIDVKFHFEKVNYALNN
ncbi:MAG: hypothetical protein PHU98_06380 [Mariniphaga sp.]|nr:hypothetical protein [Paludibacter sp.]MDD4225998.1 hypothetical protein [Mariniphaga sp.]